MKIEELKSTKYLHISDVKSGNEIIFYNVKCEDDYYIKYDNNYFKEGYLPIKDEYDVSLITMQDYDEIIKNEEDLKELSKP